MRSREIFSKMKGVTVEHDMWEKEEDLGNVRQVVKELEGRMSTEVRRQEKLNMMEEKDFRREELLGKYTVKILYRWDNGKFEKEYLRKLEGNWQKWKSSFSRGETLKGG